MVIVKNDTFGDEMPIFNWGRGKFIEVDFCGRVAYGSLVLRNPSKTQFKQVMSEATSAQLRSVDGERDFLIEKSCSGGTQEYR